MTVFRADRLVAGLAAAAFALTLSLDGVRGEGPIRLVPPEPAAGGTPPAAPSVDVRSGIEAQSLAGPNPESVGLLAAGSGGFGADLWDGSGRATVVRLIDRLPTDSASPALRDLMRRLLLTAARAPRGRPGDGDFVGARVRAALRLGDAAAAIALLDLRGDGDDPDRAEAEALLLGGQAPRACALAAERTAGPAFDPGWQKLLAFCQFLAGEPDKAAFTVSLLREDAADDPAFFALVDALSAGDPAAPAGLPDNARPVHLAMARMAGLRLPERLADHADPGVLRLIAEDAGMTLPARLDAAEKAEAAGALPTARLRSLYGEVTFTAEELDGALADPGRLAGPQGLALLLRVAARQDIPAARAEALAAGLEPADTPARQAQTARLVLPLLDDLKPTADLAWFVPHAVRAYLVAGAGDRALPWLRMLRGAARVDTAAADDLARLMPLARLAGGGLARGWRTADLARWRALAGEDPDAAALAARRTLAFALLDAAGETIPDAWWLDLLDRRVAPDAAPSNRVAWIGMQRAARARRRGETALYGLLLLGRGGPDAAPPLALAHLVRAFAAVGLEDAARAVAVEAAVARRL